MPTRDWEALSKAKVLVIGHDPRLQKSDTVADYCLFGNYYFNEVPAKPQEKRKYDLAKSTFEQILDLTNGRYKAEEIYLTNLCNNELPHAPKNHTVLIPDCKAKEGIAHILSILKDSSIEYIFPMSLQVNYLLQRNGFYEANSYFVKNSEPIEEGMNNNPPYYKPKEYGFFKLVCGNVYELRDRNCKVIPILHSVYYPSGDNFKAYKGNYNKIKNYFLSLP